jgi:hypothetical protein
MWFVSVSLGVVVVTPKPFYLVSLFDGFITLITFSKVLPAPLWYSL